MKQQDIKTLKILDEIGNDEVPSQREIAKNLNISLGLVNSFIKRLARKGYLKISSVPSNRVKYLLTPKGAAEKTRLTYQYIRYSYHFYKDARIKLKTLFSELSEKNISRVVFYGATDLAEIAYISLQETPIKLVAVFDADKAGNLFLGLKIEHPDHLSEFSYDRLLYTDEEEPDNELLTKINRGKIVFIR